MMLNKIGINNPTHNDNLLLHELLDLMNKNKLDYNNTFLWLMNGEYKDKKQFKNFSIDQWMQKWEKRINNNVDQSYKLMKNSNPVIIPRNHLIEEALSKAEKGNLKLFNTLLNKLAKPYTSEKIDAKYQSIPQGFDEKYKTFCNT